MPPIPVIVRYPRRTPDVTLPQSEDALSPAPLHQPSERRFRVPARLVSAARVAVLCLLGMAALLIAAAALSGCGGNVPPEVALRAPVCTRLSYAFYRCHDAEARVTCWTPNTINGGISCLPDSALPAEAP